MSFLLDKLASLLGPLETWSLSAGRISLILSLAWFITHFLRRLITLLKGRVSQRLEDREAAKRADTLGRVLRYIVSVVVWLVAGMLVLSEIGISVAPILGAAGVVGIAVGFGAQSLVKDFFTGFFLLLENQIRQGDSINLGTHSGIVEEITLRYVQLRDYEGNVHFVPNGQITTVINHSREYAFAVIDVSLGTQESIEIGSRVIIAAAEELRADPAFESRILGPFELAGVDRVDSLGVVLRGRIKVLAMEQWAVRRELLKRIKIALDLKRVEQPNPHLKLVQIDTRQLL